MSWLKEDASLNMYLNADTQQTEGGRAIAASGHGTRRGRWVGLASGSGRHGTTVARYALHGGVVHRGALSGSDRERHAGEDNDSGKGGAPGAHQERAWWWP